MHHRKRSILGSLVSFGVAFVLINTAGAASAQEAPPPASSPDEATLGEPQYVERPAPRPDPANELGAAPAPSAPTPAPAPPPAPAPVQPRPASPQNVVPAPAPTPVAVQSAPPAPRAVRAPARATEVQGVQIVRPAAPGDAAGEPLAFTGTTDREVALTVLASVLLALGWALVRLSRSPRLA